MDKVAKIKFEGDLMETIRRATDALGGLSKFVNPGDTVLLKPNFNTADPFPASSDPEFIEAVVELVYNCGAKQVMLGDACTFTQNTREVMEKKGIFRLKKAGCSPEVCVFCEYKWVKKVIPGGKYFKSVFVSELLDRADKVILLPCLKTHSFAQFTGSLKLSVGFMKPSQRLKLHMGHLQEKIAELNKVINPILVIMDARKCFISGGPAAGEVREPGLIMASCSRVAIDIEGIKVIQGFDGNSLAGIDPLELPQIKKAIEMGISGV